jgi:CHAT domain-containing protein
VHPPPATVICNSPRLPDGLDRGIKFSRVEALYIARRHETWPILADQTDRKTFEHQCQQSTIIHLSSHGTFNEDSPMDSNVDLFDEPLTPLDLSRLAITARFVVFSSCLSAYSRVFDSGTALSFAHALLGSGACAFVGTLWVTGDVASLVFMVLFYKAMMVKSLPPSGALADAQLIMRNFTDADKDRIVDDLLALFNEEAAKRGGSSMIENYVLNYRYWIDRQLRRYDVTDLRSPWSWAGFVLIGYGESHAYSLHAEPTSIG